MSVKIKAVTKNGKEDIFVSAVKNRNYTICLNGQLIKLLKEKLNDFR